MVKLNDIKCIVCLDQGWLGLGIAHWVKIGYFMTFKMAREVSSRSQYSTIPWHRWSRGARTMIQPFPWSTTEECACFMSVSMLNFVLNNIYSMLCATEQPLVDARCYIILMLKRGGNLPSWWRGYHIPRSDITEHGVKFLPSVKHPTISCHFSSGDQVKLLASKCNVKAGPSHISTHMVATEPSCTWWNERQKPLRATNHILTLVHRSSPTRSIGRQKLRH
jgi:hypothetical protein